VESNQLLPGFARGNFYEESTKLPSLKRAYVDSTLLVLCAINSMWNQLSFSSGFVRVNFSDDMESTQLLSLKEPMWNQPASPTDQEASWERVFDPVYNLLFDLYH